jgi:hypothetical protein
MEYFPWIYMLLNLAMGYDQQWLAHLHPSWLVSKSNSLSQHLVEQPCGKHHGSISLKKERERPPFFCKASLRKLIFDGVGLSWGSMARVLNIA